MKKTNLIALMGIIVLMGAILILILIYTSFMRIEFIPLTRGAKPAFAFNIYGRSAYGKGGLAGPLAVAAGRGEVYVADTGNKRIQVFLSDGKYLRDWPIVSASARPQRGLPPELSEPIAVALLRGEKVMVAAKQSSRLLIYSLSGRFITHFPPTQPTSTGSAPSAKPTTVGKAPSAKPAAAKAPLKRPERKRLILGRPLALAGEHRSIYVTDALDQTLKVFSSEGVLLQTLGGRKGDAKFAFANGVAADERGRIFVSDSNNNRIQLLDRFGAPLREPVRESLNLPRGIALDRLGRLHVVNAFAHNVSVFSDDGLYMFSYGTRGVGDGELNFPTGIAIDFNRIYIADKENNRVSVWNY